MDIDDDMAKMSQDEQLSLLLQAAILGRTDAIQKVLHNNQHLRTMVDENGASSLHHAVHNGQVDAVRALLRGGVPTDTIAMDGEFKGKYALELAPTHDTTIRCCFSAEALQSVMLGDLSRTRELLSSGVKPCDKVGCREDDKTLLEWAEDLSEGKSDNKAIELITSLDHASYMSDIQPPNMSEDTELGKTDFTEQKSTDSKQGVSMENHHGVESKSPIKRVCSHCSRDMNKNLIEEKDALIERLRQMLQVMAEERQMLTRLVHKQGSTTVAEHFHLLKQKNTQMEEELKVRDVESRVQAEAIAKLQDLLDDEVAAHEATKVLLEASESSKSKLLLQASQFSSERFEYQDETPPPNLPTAPTQLNLVPHNVLQPCDNSRRKSNELVPEESKFQDRFQNMARPNRGESGLGWWRWSTATTSNNTQTVGSRLVLRV